MKVGILGGSFNPIHYGHLNMAKVAQKQLNLDKVIFIPTYQPPHKHKKVVIDAKDRLNMLKLALNGFTNFKIGLEEINRGGISYSFDTIKSLKTAHPNNDYYFILGADMVKDLPNWYNIDKLNSMIKFIGLRRSSEDIVTSPYHVKWLKAPLIDISSTEIRRRVQQKQSIKGLVLPSVAQYIKEHKLYAKGN